MKFVTNEPGVLRRVEKNRTADFDKIATFERGWGNSRI